MNAGSVGAASDPAPDRPRVGREVEGTGAWEGILLPCVDQRLWRAGSTSTADILPTRREGRQRRGDLDESMKSEEEASNRDKTYRALTCKRKSGWARSGVWGNFEI